MSIESLIETDIPSGMTNGVGTISLVPGDLGVGGLIVTGAGTSFLTALANSDVIYTQDDLGNDLYLVVNAILSDTDIRVFNNASVAVTGASFTILPTATMGTYFFLGDNTKKSVPVYSPNAFALKLVSRNAAGSIGSASLFSINEGVLLKSFYLRLPYQYTLPSSTMYLAFYYETIVGGFPVHTPIPSIGEGIKTFLGSEFPNLLPVINENIEIEMNAYIPPLNAPWSIAVKLITTNPLTTFRDIDKEYAAVSQIDAPDILNGVMLPVHIGARIQHTSPMT